jgi:hypothetical protein
LNIVFTRLILAPCHPTQQFLASALSCMKWIINMSTITLSSCTPLLGFVPTANTSPRIMTVMRTPPRSPLRARGRCFRFAHENWDSLHRFEGNALNVRRARTAWQTNAANLTIQARHHSGARILQSLATWLHQSIFPALVSRASLLWLEQLTFIISCHLLCNNLAYWLIVSRLRSRCFGVASHTNSPDERRSAYNQSWNVVDESSGWFWALIGLSRIRSSDESWSGSIKAFKNHRQSDPPIWLIRLHSPSNISINPKLNFQFAPFTSQIHWMNYSKPL